MKHFTHLQTCMKPLLKNLIKIISHGGSGEETWDAESTSKGGGLLTVCLSVVFRMAFVVVNLVLAMSSKLATLFKRTPRTSVMPILKLTLQ